MGWGCSFGEGLYRYARFRMCQMLQKQESPLVSVIIPVYRVEGYIRACLESVICQTYRRVEVILVDDCGGDASVSIAEGLLRSSSLSWVTLHHERNRGLSAARNTGVERARGDYIFFLDSDDVLSPQCLELLVERALRDDADMATGQVAVRLENGEDGAFFHNDVGQDRDALDALLQGHLAVTAWNKLLRRSFYARCGVSFREGLLHEDEVWSFELALCSPKVACIDAVTYFYLQRGGSIMAGDLQDDRHFEGKLASFLCRDENAGHVLCHHNPLFWNSHYNAFKSLCLSIEQNPSAWVRLKRFCALLTLSYLPHDVPFSYSRSRLIRKVAKVFSYVLPYTWILLVVFKLTRCREALRGKTAG